MNSREFRNKLKSIRNVERGIVPDPAWVLHTREILRMQVSNSMPVAQPSILDRVRHATRLIMPSRLAALARGPMMAFLSVFGLVLGGSIASVSAAERSLPGDLLYPVKLVTEQTRLALTAGKTDKLKLKTEFVGRRVQEIKTIADSDVSQKPARIKEATDIMKQDLDTVKTQLSEATQQEPINQVAQTAKLIDQKSSEFATTLKGVKSSVSDDARSNVAEAEVAAVNTGMKAMQVLLDSHDKPEAKEVMSNEELIQSIHGKVQGIEDNIADATQKLLTSGTSTSSLLQSASSSSTATQISNAQASLDQAKQLLSENKLTEVTDKLIEAVKVMATVDNTQSLSASASSTSELPSSAATGTAGFSDVTSTNINASSTTSMTSSTAAINTSSTSPNSSSTPATTIKSP